MSLPQVLWVDQNIGLNTAAAETYPSVACDSSGNIYIAYASTGSVSGQTLVGSKDLVVIKLDTNGNRVWVKQHDVFDTVNDDSYSRPSLAVDGSGTCYITYCTLGATSGQTSQGNYDTAVLKLNSNGDVLWVRQQPSFVALDANDRGSVIAIDGSGNCYVSYDTLLGTASGQTRTGSSDIVVFKLDSSGTTQWVIQQPSFNTIEYDNGQSITVDSSGNVYICYNSGGTISGGSLTGIVDMLLFKLDTNGVLQWTAQNPSFNTTLSDSVPSMCIDGAGNLYVAYYSLGATSGQTNTGSGDIVVFKMNSNGVTQWIRQQPTFNTTLNDLHPSVTCDTYGNIYITYDSTGIASGQTFTGGTNDIVVFKMDNSGNLKWIIQQPSFNTSGVDQYPMLALDNLGNLAVAYYTTGSSSGNSNLGGNDIVVFKMTSDPPEPPCFNKDTKILCIDKNCQESYIPVQDIHPGMPVKVLHYGTRCVRMCGYATMLNDPTNWRGCMYKMTRCGNMIDDLIVTGGHSILIDKPISDPEEIALQKLYWDDKTYVLDDKYMVMAAVSKQFKKLTDTKEYTYYHLVLDGDQPDRHYGIWANGILTESQSEDDFNKHKYDKINWY